MINNNQEHYSAIQDNFGNTSSKRICGFVLLGAALVMAIVLFCLSIYYSIADSSTALKIIEYFLIGGGSLLGIGVFERMSFIRKEQ
jgi:hypothetical protein